MANWKVVLCTAPNCCLTRPTSQTGVKGTINITAEGRWK